MTGIGRWCLATNDCVGTGVRRWCQATVAGVGTAGVGTAVVENALVLILIYFSCMRSTHVDISLLLIHFDDISSYFTSS